MENKKINNSGFGPSTGFGESSPQEVHRLVKFGSSQEESKPTQVHTLTEGHMYGDQ